MEGKMQAQHGASPSRWVGDFEIIALSDGLLPTSNDAALDIDPAECERLSGIRQGETVHLSVNAFLVTRNGKRMLVDAGSSNLQGPTLGKLVPHLHDLGVDPASIEAILVTHCHPDHTNGLLDFDGNVNFPNAEIFLHEREAAFWLDRTPLATDTERLARGTRAARRALGPYSERIRRVKDGEALPGMTAISANGHTPGHTAWMIHSGSDAILMWGDTVHLPAIQVPRPDVAVIYDLDPEAARRSRLALFDRVATDGIMVAGAHLDFPGFARLTRESAGYRLDTAV
jgi:glyoxylase-like metal-dependent hydrolase (beta-lactamase superfamily II)